MVRRVHGARARGKHRPGRGGGRHTGDNTAQHIVCIEHRTNCFSVLLLLLLLSYSLCLCPTDAVRWVLKLSTILVSELTVGYGIHSRITEV